MLSGLAFISFLVRKHMASCPVLFCVEPHFQNTNSISEISRVSSFILVLYGLASDLIFMVVVVIYSSS